MLSEHILNSDYNNFKIDETTVKESRNIRATGLGMQFFVYLTHNYLLYTHGET